MWGDSMANEIKIDLSLSGEQAVARGLDNVGDKAEQAGDDLKGMAADAGFLDKRLVELRKSTRELALEFARTGDKDLFKQLQGAKREQGQLERIQKQFLDVGVKVGGSAGGEAGKHFGEGFTKSLMSLRGPAIGVLVGVAAAAAPFLSGVISSAVIGGVGFGGIIGGLALAAKDSRVQDAAELLGTSAMSKFTKSADVFIQPAVDAMSVLDSAVDDVSGSMREAFASVAPTLVPLTRGLTGLVREMMPGLIDAMKGAKPVLLTIGAELPKIGRALSEFLSTISRDPRGAIVAFQDLSRIIQGTLVVTGNFLAALSALWAKISPILKIAQGDIAGAVASQAAMNYALAEAERLSNEAAGGLENLGDSADDAKTEMMGLNDAIENFISKQLGVDQATVNWQKGLRDLNEELREGKRTLALNSEEGLKNRDAMLEMIGAAEGFRQKLFEQTGDLDGANAAYQQNIKTLYDMGRAAGFSKKELDALFGPYMDGPRIAITEFQFPGLTAGLAKAKELARLLGSKAAASAAGGNYLNDYTEGTYVSGRASGGPVMAGQTYVVGEDGPEVLQMGASGGFVHNASATKAMMSGASGGSAIPIALTIKLVPPPGVAGDVIASIMTAIRVEVAAQGGNVQTVLGQS
jgi:hypothetical protein